MVRTIRIEVGENSTSGVLTLCEVEVFSANPPGRDYHASVSRLSFLCYDYHYVMIIIISYLLPSKIFAGIPVEPWIYSRIRS